MASIYTNKGCYDPEEAEEAKADIYDVYDRVPNEVTGLLQELEAGRIKGNSYDGECCCLVGTACRLKTGTTIKESWSLSQLKITTFPHIREHVREPNSSSPAEEWFFHIRPGNTPENNIYAALVKEWTLEWLEQKGRIK